MIITYISPIDSHCRVDKKYAVSKSKNSIKIGLFKGSFEISCFGP
jgi:hypothetical protein